MTLSVVIVTWNSEKDIRACLNSIQLNSLPEKEVIVIDNNSQDRTTEIIEAEFPDIRLVKNRKNFGYARANNQGILLSQGRYILLLNPDTKLETDVLTPMIDFMEKNPQVGSLGPKVLNPDGSIQQSVRQFPNYEILLWEFLLLSRLFPKNRRLGKWRMGYFDYNSLTEVDQPMASCLLIQRAALAKIGLMDERFPFYFNDVDLSLRLKQAGYKAFFFPNARVWHKRGASTEKAQVRMIFEFHKSLFTYFLKHDRSLLFPLKAVLLILLLFLSALIRISIAFIKQLTAT